MLAAEGSSTSARDSGHDAAVTAVDNGVLAALASSASVVSALDLHASMAHDASATYGGVGVASTMSDVASARGGKKSVCGTCTVAVSFPCRALLCFSGEMGYWPLACCSCLLGLSGGQSKDVAGFRFERTAVHRLDKQDMLARQGSKCAECSADLKHGEMAPHWRRTGACSPASMTCRVLTLPY